MIAGIRIERERERERERDWMYTTIRQKGLFLVVVLQE